MLLSQINSLGKSICIYSLPMNFTNILNTAFTKADYKSRFQKRKKILTTWLNFYTSGVSVYVKAALKMLMKSTQGGHTQKKLLTLLILRRGLKDAIYFCRYSISEPTGYYQSFVSRHYAVIRAYGPFWGPKNPSLVMQSTIRGNKDPRDSWY